MLRFEILKKDEGSGARRGLLHLKRITCETPLFMPVGTAGSVKGITPHELKDCGYRLILSNTYHLYLRPGHMLIREHGGLHRFMGWNRAILTDSGGFQVYSLSPLRTVTEEGVRFQSHIDGSYHMLTPETVVGIQEALGSDILMPLDECLPYPASEAQAKESLDLTTRWLSRSVAAHSGKGAMFGIVQGGFFENLRLQAAAAVTAMNLPGYSIGGLSVGEPVELLHETGSFTANLLPQDRPRYLMGVGRPQDIVEAVSYGIDMFDCVVPTRNARNGTLYTWQGKINIKAQRFSKDQGPVDSQCQCYTCRNFSRAYLRHLYQAGELLSSRLNTIHNLHFFSELMAKIRCSVSEGWFGKLKIEIQDRYPFQ